MFLLLVMAFILGVIGIIYTTLMIYQSGALDGVISYFKNKNDKKDIEINTNTNTDINTNTNIDINIDTNKIDFNLYKIECDFCGCVEIMTEKEYEEYKIKINNSIKESKLFDKVDIDSIKIYICTSCFDKITHIYDQNFKFRDKINEYKLSPSAKKIIGNSISDSNSEQENEEKVVNNE